MSYTQEQCPDCQKEWLALEDETDCVRYSFSFEHGLRKAGRTQQCCERQIKLLEKKLASVHLSYESNRAWMVERLELMAQSEEELSRGIHWSREKFDRAKIRAAAFMEAALAISKVE